MQSTLVLYTRPFGPYLLTVGAFAETRVSILRRLVQGVSDQVFSQALNNANGFVRQIRPAENTPQRSYVLVWQPVEPLTAERCAAIRQVLPTIARSQGIILEHLIINEKFVHVVALCPPRRGSGWMAQTLKDRSAAALIGSDGKQDPLWIEGYYARESTTPLSAAELNRLIMLPRA